MQEHFLVKVTKGEVTGIIGRGQEGSGRAGKSRPFSWYVTVVIIVVVIIVVSGMSLSSYLITRQEFERTQEVLRTQTENHISESILLMEAGLNLYDDTYNNRMKHAFEPFITEYNLSGGDPAKVDLEKLKRAADNEFELYIIDDRGVIIETTFGPEKGLDFRQYAPYFVDYLNKIRSEGGFHPDRVVKDFATGQTKKFAYMATPDHRYILELGLSREVFIPERSQFGRPVTQIMADVRDQNPYIRNISLYDSTIKQQTEKGSVKVPNGTLRERIKEIFKNKTKVVVSEPENGTTRSYIYINTSAPQYGSDTSRVAEIVYDDSLAAGDLQKLVFANLAIGLLVGAIGIAGGLIGAQALTWPIRLMVSDVDEITAGNLEHQVRPPLGWELKVLALRINDMVLALRNSIKDLTVSQKALGESRELYRVVVETQSEFIARLTANGTITFANEAYMRFFGVDTEDLEGREFAVAVDDDDRLRLASHIASLSMERPTDSIEYRVAAAGGAVRWISRTDTALFSATGDPAGYLSVGRDVTDRIEARQELVRANEELESRVLERTRELEHYNRELTSFSYTVSHDLRAPLRAIDGFSRILEQDYSDGLSEEAVGYIHRVRDNARNMSNLIDDLLELSRTGRRVLEMVDVDIARVVQDCIEDLAPAMKGRSVRITTGELPPCRADPVLVRQVFVNLISNALKYSKPREHAEILIGSSQEEGRTVYHVKDNGIGFDMAYKDKIFGVFERLHRADEYEGTGVGLAIVKQIIERHGGKIWVDASPGNGAAFYFTFGQNSGP
jgi:PAS domain S-box-containing protein